MMRGSGPPANMSGMVQVLTPVEGDSEVVCHVLNRGGFAARIAGDLNALGAAIEESVNAIIIAEEALSDAEANHRFGAVLERQPDWSDVPIILLARHESDEDYMWALAQTFEGVGNVTILERPLRRATLLNAVSVALRARRRQRDLRLLLEERIADAASLRESRERYRRLFEAAPVAVFTCDAAGVIQDYNLRALEIWRRTPRRGDPNECNCGAVQLRQLDGTALDARNNPLVEVLRSGAARRHVELEIERPDGSRVPAVFNFLPLKNALEMVIGAIVSFDEISERKRLEAERERLLVSERAARTTAEQALRVKDDFVATISHELRTPLTGILGWAQLLLRSQFDSERVIEAARAIERGARMQSHLINDLLDMSRIVSGKFKLDLAVADLVQVLNGGLEAMQHAAHEKQIRLESVISGIEEPMVGDGPRLQQVVMNLLSNAIKFTPKGGLIRVSLARRADEIELRVADSGIGIRADFLPLMFDRFRQADASITRRYGGLGLGLAIVKQIVELHGGTIAVESPGEGQGAVFTVRLPAQPIAREEAPEAPQPAAVVTLHGARVLLVEDDPDASEFVQRLLNECDATVAATNSGRQALSMIASTPPDLLLCDISLPEMDGYEVIRRVRAQGLRLPAIAITAFARSDDRSNSLRAGYDMHLSKPVDAEVLLSAVQELLNGR